MPPSLSLLAVAAVRGCHYHAHFLLLSSCRSVSGSAAHPNPFPSRFSSQTVAFPEEGISPCSNPCPSHLSSQTLALKQDAAYEKPSPNPWPSQTLASKQGAPEKPIPDNVPRRPFEPVGSEGLPARRQFEPVGSKGLPASRPFEPSGSEGLSARRPFEPAGSEGLLARRPLRPDGVDFLTGWWIRCYQQKEHVMEDLSGMLQNMEIWIAAYQRVCHEASGKFAPRAEIDRRIGFDLQNLRDTVLSGSFVWGGYRKIHLVSPEHDFIDVKELGSTTRKKFLAMIHASPIFQDRVVQEVLLMVLEPIFEARFSSKSHGFRPCRNAHTALRVVRRAFPGYLWFIQGNLEELLPGPRSGLFAEVMFKTVPDRSLITLIKQGMRTEPPPPLPVVGTKKMKYKKKKKLSEEDGPKPDPYWLQSFFGFAPVESQPLPEWGSCGVLSRLLLNVFLDELDKWFEAKTKEFYLPSTSDSIWNDPEQAYDAGSTVQFIPESGPEKSRRMDYIRYGTNILVGMRGRKGDAAGVQNDLLDFLREKLGVSLSRDDLPIVHIREGAMFLDHVISSRVVQPTIMKSYPGGKVSAEKATGTVLSMTVSLKQCMLHLRRAGFLKGDLDAQPCLRLFHAPQEFSNAQINKVLQCLSLWFRYADNRKKATTFCQYILRSSLAKLYAAKYKLRSRAKVYKIGSGDLSRPIKEKKGLSEHYKQMMDQGFLDEEIEGILYRRVSQVPDVDLTPLPKNWMPNHERMLNELARLETPCAFEEHLQILKKVPTITPQENMSRVVWNCFGGLYHLKTDNVSSSHENLIILRDENGIVSRHHAEDAGESEKEVVVQSGGG